MKVYVGCHWSMEDVYAEQDDPSLDIFDDSPFFEDVYADPDLALAEMKGKALASWAEQVGDDSDTFVWSDRDWEVAPLRRVRTSIGLNEDKNILFARIVETELL